MASRLKLPNLSITQGFIQYQWCDLKLQCPQGYAIHRKVHIKNRDPLRKRLKFEKVKLRTPEVCMTVANYVSQGNQDSQTSGNPTQEVIGLSKDLENEGCAQGELELKQNEIAQSDEDSVKFIV